MTAKHIAYVISMVQPGMSAYNYREIEALTRKGLEISIFPTKYFAGPYMPKPEWYVGRYNLPAVLLQQVCTLFSRPLAYCTTLATALRFGAVIEFLVATRFAALMKARGVERIHCHFGDRKLYVGYFCKRLLGLPLSVTLHAHELYSNVNWRLFPVALRSCSTIVCIADLNKRLLVEKWGIPDRKMKVIRLFGYENGDRRPIKILCVGRFEAKKGHAVLIAALKRIKDIDFELWLAGSPPAKGGGVDVSTLVEKNGLAERVVFFGEVPESTLKVLYRECDIFCLPSVTDNSGVPEGIPVVLMEAMSMGKPVIATPTGATTELVENVLVGENAVEELEAAIRKLALDADLRRRLGARNRQIVRSKYSPSNIEPLFALLAGRT